jgi:hypothetical protein
VTWIKALPEKSGAYWARRGRLQFVVTVSRASTVVWGSPAVTIEFMGDDQACNGSNWTNGIEAFWSEPIPEPPE